MCQRYVYFVCFCLLDLSDDVDKVLQHLESHAGVDYALMQAKLWAKYVKEIISYVEKKNALRKFKCVSRRSSAIISISFFQTFFFFYN